jgi:NADPH-dependent curcumin reductase CurA
MSGMVNRQWRLAHRPAGLVRESDLEWSEESVPAPGPGQVLVRNDYLSIDPSCRAWMWQEDTALPAQRLGSVMRGITVGTVVESRNGAVPEGTSVQGLFGWQDYTVSDGASEAFAEVAIGPDVTPAMHLGLLGHVGTAAYFGLLELGQPRAGQTLVVSSAAGAVGSLVGQIGKLYGCYVVGIAGSQRKCRWLCDELGFDAAIDYKVESVYKALKQRCPSGVDIYFDNVGGAILEDVLGLLNQHARVVCSGMLSVYNAVGGFLTLPPGPNNLLNLVLKRARMEGFAWLDFQARQREATQTLLSWHQSGRLQYRVELVEGLRNAPRALNRLFDGSSQGKLVLKMS